METNDSPKEEEKKIVAAQNARVVGKIKNDDGKAVGGVSVIIYDSRNNEIKRTKSNRGGTWFAFLPPGEYSVNYLGKKLGINKNFNFEINMGEQEVNL